MNGTIPKERAAALPPTLSFVYNTFRMPKKKTEEQEAPQAAEGALATVAKAVGKAAGKVAKLAGAEPSEAPPAAPKKPKIPKLAPKNKSRLPRRQKKALQKANQSK